MSFIKGRLKRLEVCRRSGECDSCGLPPNGHGRIALIDEEHPEKSFKGDPEECCGSCGRFLWTTIKIVYEDSEAGDAA